jgi:hypothetical protein
VPKGPQEPQDQPVRLAIQYGRRYREVTAVVGAEYTVDPLNPQKLKHRGRQCTLLGLVRDDIGTPMKAQVRFLDNGRQGRVDLEDLTAPGLTKDRGPSPAPAHAEPESPAWSAATLNLDGLEHDIDLLLNGVSEQLKRKDNPPPDEATADILFTTLLMEGMEQMLQYLAQNVAEPEARNRIAHMRQRFGGFKGATRAVTEYRTRRLQRLIPKH